MELPLSRGSGTSRRVFLTRRSIFSVICITIGVYAIYSFAVTGYYHHSALSEDVSWVSESPETTSISSMEASSTSAEEIPITPSTSSSTPVASAPALDEPSNAINMTRRANATLLMLARNSEVETAANSVRELEERFNKNFGYPWVFLNEVEFSDEFKQKMSEIIAGPVSFGLVPPEHWFQPDWIDEARAKEGRDWLTQENVIYGESVPYRNMCRFNSGFFYRHPLLQKYKWYWRVEPDVHFTCNIEFDPFKYMEENDKVYGFTITPYEWEKTIPTLWSTVKEFMSEYPQYISPDNAMDYLSDDGGETYNLCHFWSNFEIADMDFWRGEAYSKFFDFLDARGGFYYERWGDAPVHSMGVGLLARKDQIHFFDQIGYEHAPFQHCPQDTEHRNAAQCSCMSWYSFDYQGYSCMRQWDRIHV